MSQFRRPSRRLTSCLLAFATGLLATPRLHAQSGDILPADGTDAMRREYNLHRSFLPDLFKGKIAVRNKSDEERYNKGIDFEARWTLYRLTWPENQTDPGKLNKIVKEFEDDLYNLQRNKPDTQYVIQEFSKQTVVRAKEVLQTTRPIARVNAAYILEKLAATGAAQNELADAFVELLTDGRETNEGVKLFALRGIRNLLALPQPKTPILAKEREEKAILAALEFVQRAAAFTPVAPREEVEGFRSLRREGFRALASARHPSLGDKAKPALVLLKAAVSDGLAPEPRLDERIEAAVGVTRLSPELDSSYNKDYAAFILAHFVVDLGVAYQTRAQRPEEKRPYKAYAVRMLDGLDALKADSKNKPVDDYARSVVAECVKVLSKIETDGVAQPFDLSRWLENNQPPNKQVYKGVADSTVKPAAREPAETTTGG